jgi:hypothetical protein
MVVAGRRPHARLTRSKTCPPDALVGRRPPQPRQRRVPVRGRNGLGRRRAPRPHHRGRPFRARRDCQRRRRLARGRFSLPRRLRPPSRLARLRNGDGRRPPHSLGRREATVRLPAVGIGLCRAHLRRDDVARFRRRRSRCRDRRFPRSRATVRGTRRDGARRRMRGRCDPFHTLAPIIESIVTSGCKLR